MKTAQPWTEVSPEVVRRRFDRLAKHYVLLEWLLTLPPGIRRRGVQALNLRIGDSVLEVGCGTGRNLSLLRDAVGEEGRIYGIDLSEGMLAEARELIARHGWKNVELLHADALTAELPSALAGALFSLSYGTMAERRRILRRIWTCIHPEGRVVILDAKVPAGMLGILTRKLIFAVSRATVLGNPDHKPWDDLSELTPNVELREELLGSYFICVGAKAPSGAG
ncbi:MAG TPA: methyltransferase domain-containing protein [Thermoanaerobaculia bacterium]